MGKNKRQAIANLPFLNRYLMIFFIVFLLVGLLYQFLPPLDD